MNDVGARGRFRVHTRYDSPYPDSIRFSAGETVTAGETFSEDPDWKEWIRCSNGAGKEAWVPLQYLELTGTTAVFLKEYDARELTIIPGEIVEVLDTVNGFAFARSTTGEVGWAPLKCISPETT